MTIRHMEILKAISETGSFTKAARFFCGSFQKRLFVPAVECYNAVVDVWTSNTNTAKERSGLWSCTF